MTIRRDLDTLDDSGALTKVHGGATASVEHSSHEPGFIVKSQLRTLEKQAIAVAAAELCADGAAIGITAGTTTAELASRLRQLPNLTIVTNSLAVAEVFALDSEHKRTVLLTGGERTPSNALVGPVAVNSLQSFHLDMVFMGVHGVHDLAGFTTPNLAEAATNRAFIASTDRLVVLADHTKWGLSGLATIAPLNAASTLVTDSGLHDDAVGRIQQSIDHVVAADIATTSRKAETS